MLPDKYLIDFERNAQETAELRKTTGSIVRLLHKFLELQMVKILMPSKECFFPGMQVDRMKTSPTPNFTAANTDMSLSAFRLRTMFDLMSAHFAAGHFTVCKNLHGKVSERANLPCNAAENLDTQSSVRREVRRLTAKLPCGGDRSSAASKL